MQGETRFVCSTGPKKIYMTITAAAGVIKPVLEVLDTDFSAADIQVRSSEVIAKLQKRKEKVGATYIHVEVNVVGIS